MSRRAAVGLLAAAAVLAGCSTATAGADGSGSPASSSSSSSPNSSGSSADPSSTDSSTDSSSESSGPSSASGSVPAELEFRARTVAGEAFDGATLAGRPTVLWFWAPWCSTCAGQVTGVGALAAEHAGEVNVVGVGGLDEPGAIEQFAGRVDDEVVMLSDPEGELWRRFGVTAQSTYLVLDEAGGTVASGYLEDAELADTVAGLVD